MSRQQFSTICARWLLAVFKGQRKYNAHVWRVLMSTGRLWFSAIGLTAAVMLTGCTAVKVKLGMRVRLDKLPVTTMEASLPMGPAMAPGETTSLVVTFTDTSGKVWVTEGKGKGKILWSDLKVTTSLVTINKKGVLRLAHDPRKSDGKIGNVEISAPSHPDLHASLGIPVRYDYPFVVHFDGASGMSGTDGINGTDGTSGSSGSVGSCDPDNNSAGGDGGRGSDGSDGTNGSDGGKGSNASPVKVMITLRVSAHPLLQAVVSAPNRKDRHFLVDPQGGSLSITANGGTGGSGGRGGRGGRGGGGGSGGFGCPSGSNGLSGSDGRDGMTGSDGSSGNGGSITIVYDPSVKPYLQIVKTSNTGASAPIYQESPVAPLW
jgi:hypothetical protein